MNYRKFGNTDLQVSEVGFGAWAIGGDAMVGNTPIGWGPADDRVSVAAVHSALDAGINFFDTADFYGLGHSEALLGDALAGNNTAIIATKVGHRNIDNSFGFDYSAKYIVQACEESLKRLKRGVIDYYQLHSARLAHLQAGECVEAMQQLKQQGKIRYWGLSLNTFAPAPEADWMMERGVGDGFQLVFNLVNQRAYDTMLRAGKNGYGIIARMPLQFGLLTGKFTPASTFTAADHRNFRLTPEIMRETLNILENKVWPIGKQEGLNPVALALSFILSCPEVSTVIPGIRTPEHVAQNTSGLKSLQPKQFEYLLSLAHTDWKPVMEVMEKQG
ncbi:MAG TPA: aldo/keto reductase [Chitinophagaceae bacterium]|nr:aldo/keto reductase [Chitinophagaceae bacterium]